MGVWNTDARWKTSGVLHGAGGKKQKLSTVHMRTVCGFVICINEIIPGSWEIRMRRDRATFVMSELPSQARAKGLSYEIARKLANLPGAP